MRSSGILSIMWMIRVERGAIPIVMHRCIGIGNDSLIGRAASTRMKVGAFGIRMLCLENLFGFVVEHVGDERDACHLNDLLIGGEKFIPGAPFRLDLRAPAMSCWSPSESLSKIIRTAIAPQGIFFISLAPTLFYTS